MSRVCTCTVLLILSAIDRGHAWGHVFSQFTPHRLNSFGYGAAQNGRHYHQSLLSGIELEDEETKSVCRAKPCISNEQCCDSYLCIDSHLKRDDSVYGECMPHFEQREGVSCASDGDCGASLQCRRDNGLIATCQALDIGTHAYYETCQTSTDCNVVKGLCCQLLRQHRQKPRKACLYFNDPLMCVGHVPMEKVRANIEHMASEKRLIARLPEIGN